ncbi:MAG TPA: DUF3568 family protein, partial [Phycisphaerales bacterium]|nr:DUF3568 family protein [Phycisphaerales bacterium]
SPARSGRVGPATTAASPAPSVPRPAPATYGSVSRELSSAEQAAIDLVTAAARDALRDLELRDISAAKDGLLATVSAKTVRDERVTVSLTRLTSGVTEVRIKVGFWGDEPRSRAILAEIRKNLASPPEVASVLPPIHALTGPTPAGHSAHAHPDTPSATPTRSIASTPDQAMR